MTISGTNNWNLLVRRENGGVTILRAKTCDAAAALPERLLGLPVTAVGDRCFRCDGELPEGESVTVTCGSPEGEFDNRSLKSLCLPSGIRTIGDYAFMNCRALETLQLTDSVESIGSCVFMNCRSFRRVELARLPGRQGPALAGIVGSLPNELEVLTEENGGERLRLIFPEYTEIRDENEPTHFFNYVIAGGGYPYHNVFQARKLELTAYDGLWRRFLSAEHEESTALRLAWNRLRYPAGLSSAAGEDYQSYVKAHFATAAKLVIRERDLTGLGQLLGFCSPGAAELDEALGCANRAQFTEAAALLLEKRRCGQGSARNRSFSF